MLRSLVGSEMCIRDSYLTVVAYEGETDPSIAEYADNLIWTKIGQVGKALAYFAEKKSTHIALAGGVSSVKRLSDISLDARGAAVLIKARSHKDDLVLRAIAKEVEADGMEMVGCASFTPEWVAEEGMSIGKKLSKSERKDVEEGLSFIRHVSEFHVGQTVVVKNGVVVAVEAAEGTDAVILRAGKVAGPNCVVVKISKPNQDLRFDVPTIGLQTIDSLKEAKTRVFAVEAGKCLIVQKDLVLKAAKEAGISLISV